MTGLAQPWTSLIKRKRPQGFSSYEIAVDLSHSGTLGSVERGQVELKTLMMAPGHVKDPGSPASAMMVYC